MTDRKWGLAGRPLSTKLSKRGRGCIYIGQKSHYPVGGPSCQKFKACMEISDVSQISLEYGHLLV